MINDGEPVRYDREDTRLLTATALHARNKGYKGPPPLLVNGLRITNHPFNPASATGDICSDCKFPSSSHVGYAQAFKPGPITMISSADAQNPKNVMGRNRLPIFSVVPFPALLEIAKAMQYGADEAPNASGVPGYGRMNWREQKIEAMGYIDAATRHMARWVDGQELDKKSGAKELAHAAASLIVLIDAWVSAEVIDDRPRRAHKSEMSSQILDTYESQRKE